MKSLTSNLLFIVTITLLSLPAYAQLAFPGAQGFGADSQGGRGGRVYHVTRLVDDRQPGSLRYAVEAKGPRIVVFDVAGTIALTTELKISHPYITIAGQTAPGDGICLKDHGLVVSADQVVIRYIRVRLGDNQGAESDCIWVANGRHIIIDHCSTSWSVDETLSTSSGNPTLGNVTIQWCMITESLNCSIHTKGCHGYGSLIRGGWGNGVSYHHNLYADHRGRSPRPGNYKSHTIDPLGFIFDFRNNLVYNWDGNYAGYNADTDSITHMNFVGNDYREGPDSTHATAFREQCVYSQAYFSDNRMNGIIPDNPWSLVRLDGFSSAQAKVYRLSEPVPVATVTTDDPNTTYERILAGVGCSGARRDLVDLRVLGQVLQRTGAIINDEQDVGGWPTLMSDILPVDTDQDGMPDDWERAMHLDPNDPSDGPRDQNGDGYTNVEEYLNWLCLGVDLPTGLPDPNDPNGMITDPNQARVTVEPLALRYAERDQRQEPSSEIVDLLDNGMTRILDANTIISGKDDCVLAMGQEAAVNQATYSQLTTTLTIDSIILTDDQALVRGHLQTDAPIKNTNTGLDRSQDVVYLFQQAGSTWVLDYERLSTTQEAIVSGIRR